MSILDQFLNDVAATPEDWSLRGVLADWAEDNNRPQLAECLRWMIRRHKRPYHGSSGGGTWFNADTIAQGLGDPESDIPAAVFMLLEGGNEVANHKSFTTLRAAEEAFQLAWVKAMENGWKPE
jgi:uncharacterized protein (TIGR02996 family)